MAIIPKWKTSKFTIVGWISFGMVMLLVIVDIIFALIDKYITDFPTISNYVSERAEDEALFMIIILIILVWLIVHWFYTPAKKWYKQWF